ncbi:MAG TPA: hypothetical protein VFQ63_00805, partial [Patescibacteria group bacterium]|nr:hypothetical protein [Patescibacteria group bacterium]
MYPKQEKFHEKKIPGILGVMILIVGVVVTTFLALKTTNLFQHAAPSENPNDIRITNITDSSFTVTYRTDTPVPGSVSLTSSQDPNPSVILDDRDQLSGTPHAYGVHSLTAKNLSPQTTYSFSIISGTTTFLNNGNPFAVSTAATISAKPTTQPPAAGRILTAQGNKPDEALIYITSPDGQLVSTLIKPSGLYILPLNTLRTKDLSSYATLSPETPLEILVETAQETAHAKVSAGNTNPVAPMTLSEDYDFTQTSTPIASSSAAGGFPLFSLDT